MSVFTATLMVRAPLLLFPSRGGADVSVSMPLGSERMPLLVPKRHRDKLKQEVPEGEQWLLLYPRTNAEGVLWQGTTLASWKALDTETVRDIGFHARGKLFKVDKEQAMLMLGILPNPKGQLAKSFALPLVASLAVLESLPRVNSGLEVWGELKPRSGRIVVTRAEAVTLPLVRPRPKPVGEKAEQADRETEQ